MSNFAAVKGVLGNNKRGWFVDVYDRRGFLITQVVKDASTKGESKLFKTAGQALDGFLKLFPNTDSVDTDWNITVVEK